MFSRAFLVLVAGKASVSSEIVRRGTDLFEQFIQFFTSTGLKVVPVAGGGHAAAHICYVFVCVMISTRCGKRGIRHVF